MYDANLMPSPEVRMQTANFFELAYLAERWYAIFTRVLRVVIATLSK